MSTEKSPAVPIAALGLLLLFASAGRALAEPHATLHAQMMNGHPALSCTNGDTGFPSNGHTWGVEQADWNGSPAFLAHGADSYRPGSGGTLFITADRVIYQDAKGQILFNESKDAIKWKSGGEWQTIEFQSSRQKFRFYTNVQSGAELDTTAWYPQCRDLLIAGLANFSETTKQFNELTTWLPPGRLERFRRDFQPAAAAWRALPTKPALDQEADRHWVLAENAIKEKNLSAAETHYVAALLIQPMWPTGWYNLALIAAELNDYTGAADCMRHYLELTPNAPDAKGSKDQMFIWDDKAQSQLIGPLQSPWAQQAGKPSVLEKQLEKMETKH
jgi:tetratricopeptide (TPR) repeat protein